METNDDQSGGVVGDDPADSVAAGTELFPGDQGTLSVDTRRAFVQLLQGPSVDGRRQTKLWQVLLRDEALLRQHLHNIFLELVVDYDQSVAFTRQLFAESVDAPVLLRRASLTFLESVLVLFLRQRLIQADVEGERAVVSKSEMFEHLSAYERDRNVDHARFERQMNNAVEKTKKLNLIHKIRGGEERFEVSPTLKLLFPAEDIEALAQTYQSILVSDEARSGEDAVLCEDDSDSNIGADEPEET
ncbi:DUF4194 domain-containing protein [Rugamonas sp. FT82W]|uniref:DUF4194 domain-containing protein n=1 Tax=Duganella vulcania TaxID=2692166 RepID=A0A845G6Z8_9BURK|nr:DUF4194 domain-containing protein [Duganella vulcania]MYM88906.1 DUF4194 domain-containing protein [Duganella vulcania]